MIDDNSAKMTSVQWVDQQFKCYPDSEEKSQVYTLAEWIDMHKKGIVNRDDSDIDYTENFMRRQEKFQEMYWEFNIAIGRLKASKQRSLLESKRWIYSFIVSFAALVVACISLYISTNA